jgi:hypothetical protein
MVPPARMDPELAANGGTTTTDTDAVNAESVRILVVKYQSYTTSTIATLLKLAKKGDEYHNNEDGSVSVSIRQLHQIVDLIKSKKRTLSKDLEFALRYTIECRRLVSWYFLIQESYKASWKTLRHIHFVEQLQEMHARLFPDAVDLVKHAQYCDASSQTSWPQAINGVLHDIKSAYDNEILRRASSMVQIRLEDRDAKILRYLCQAEDLVQRVKWTYVTIAEAGEAKPHILNAWSVKLASSLSRCVFNRARSTMQLDVAQLQKATRSRFAKFLIYKTHENPERYDHGYDGFIEGSGLEAVMEALHLFFHDKKRAQLEVDVPLTELFPVHLQWVAAGCTPWEDIRKTKDEEVAALLIMFTECMDALPVRRRTPTQKCHYRQASKLPLAKLLKEYQKVAERDRASSDAAFKLIGESQMLLQSMKASLAAGGSTGKATDYLEFVRTAIGVVPKFDDKYQMLSRNPRLEAALDEAVSACWVSPNHRLIDHVPAISSTLILNAYTAHLKLGMKLLNAYSVLGAVLHMYNLLRLRRTDFVPSGWLDGLSAVFGWQVFGTETPPTENLAVAWMGFQHPCVPAESWSWTEMISFNNQRPIDTSVSVFWEHLDPDYENDPALQEKASLLLARVSETVSRECVDATTVLPAVAILDTLGKEVTRSDITPPYFRCPISHDLIRTYHSCCLILQILATFQAQIFIGYEDRLQREGWFTHSNNDIERGVQCLHLYLLRDHFGIKVHPDSLKFMEKAIAVSVLIDMDPDNHLC